MGTILKHFITSLHRTTGSRRHPIEVYDKVNYVQTLVSVKRQRYPQHMIFPGDFIRCSLHDESFSNNFSVLIPTDDGSGQFFVFKVYAFIGSETDGVFALAVRGIPQSGQTKRHLYNFQPFTLATISVLKMSSTVRKCFAIHACDSTNGCAIREHKTIYHHISSTEPSTFTILGRKEGYPPRRS